MHRRFLAWALLSAFAIVGAPSCADTLDGDDGDGDGGSGGGSSSKSCADFEDADGDIVEVKFQNNSLEEIYISTWCDIPDRPAFTLLRDGSEVNIDPFCTAGGTCENLQSDTALTCPSGCKVGDLVRIEAGATYTFSWHATEQVLAPMSDSCYAETKLAFATGECWQKIRLTEATTKATGEYYRRIDVEQGAGCPCMTGIQPNVCVVDKANCDLYGGNPPLPEVGVDLPSNGEIVFPIN